MTGHVEAKMCEHITSIYPRAVIADKFCVLNGFCELCFLPHPSAVDYYACIRRPDGTIFIVRDF